MDRRFLLLPSFAAVLVFLLAGAAPAVAQQQDATAPAHVAIVDGSATLERDGHPERSPVNMPLLSGDRLRTSDGRVEVLFGDASTLDLDAGTTIDFEADDLLRLIDGRIRISIPGASRTVSYRVDSPAGSARIMEPGDYRLSLLHGDRETQLELAVIRGSAEISTDQGTTALRAGERAYASAGLAPSYPYTYNSADMDTFDQWAEGQRDARLSASAAYLPSNIRSYAPVLDQYGDWRYAQPYGYVWYPRVAAGWRPYYHGRWISYPRYGWTWVGLDGFGWPTHHYGRWGFSAGAWFWIPGSHWSPAWVSWAYAPGYVSWCPLGFDNRAVFQINVAVGNHYHYSPWNAWTVVGAPYFGRGFVHQRAVYVDRLSAAQRPVFVTRPAAPALRDVAVPRNVAPIRAAGVASTPGVEARGSYFSRGGDRGEHIVAPGAGAPLSAPARARDTAIMTAPGPQPSDPRAMASPRAVPRAGGMETPRAPQRSAPSNGYRAATRGSGAIASGPAPRAVAPHESNAPQRIERISPAPETTVPVHRGVPPVREERSINRPSQGYSPPAPREYARPGIAAPRGAPAPPEYARSGIAVPRPSAPPPARVDAPRPAPAPAPAPAAAPAQPSRGQGQAAPRAVPRGRG